MGLDFKKTIEKNKKDCTCGDCLNFLPGMGECLEHNTKAKLSDKACDKLYVMKDYLIDLKKEQ